MAWRPTQHLIEGELDNTQPGKVSGWMRFAGVQGKVTFDLSGNFHRDIRGAKIQLRGSSEQSDADAVAYLQGFATHQAGKVGDITAGREPRDYVDYPYIEWYSEQNGRVVIELDPDQVTVIGAPIPFIESDPISRVEEEQNLAEFMRGLLRDCESGTRSKGHCSPAPSDPQFSHWVVHGSQIVGEARAVRASGDTMRYAFVRLFAVPECAEFGYVPACQLREKDVPAPA